MKLTFVWLDMIIWLWCSNSITFKLHYSWKIPYKIVVIIHFSKTTDLTTVFHIFLSIHPLPFFIKKKKSMLCAYVYACIRVRIQVCVYICENVKYIIVTSIFWINMEINKEKMRGKKVLTSHKSNLTLLFLSWLPQLLSYSMFVPVCEPHKSDR